MDILTPGIMNIPAVPNEQVVHIDRLPVMPLLALMILKLQAWEDHRNSPKPWQRPKQYVHAKDLKGLLPIAIRRGESLQTEHYAWIPSSLIEAAQSRVTRYILYFPKQAQQWRQIGVRSVE